MSVLEPGEQAAGRGERRRRRVWSAEEKRRMVAETFAPDASVSLVARRHDVNANMLFTWRRQASAAESSGSDGAVTFVPATITAEPGPMMPPAVPAPAGRMEIALAGGERVIVGPDVDAAALARVIRALSRR
ncbi:MAG: transposase [Vicinamibacterales bacterium]